MTEFEVRTRVCKQARAWLGLREIDESYWPIMEVYNSIQPAPPRNYYMKRSDPWCAAFVSAVAQITDLTRWIYPECSCPKMLELYKTAKRWMENDDYCPLPADIIFYDWEDTGHGDNTGTPDHVGIVVREDMGLITVIEGNCSDAVSTRYLRVGDKFIRGYGLPNYAAAAAELSEDEPEDHPDEDEFALAELPYLGYGSAGWSVCSAQGMLIAHGFSCGPDGADGDFGKNTRTAAVRFQRSKGLPETGDIDPLTWRALLLGNEA